MFKHA